MTNYFSKVAWNSATLELRNFGMEIGKTNYFSKVAWNSGIPELRNFGTLASWNLDQLPPQAQHVDQRYQRTGAVMVLGDHPQLTAPVTNPFHLHSHKAL